MNDPPEKAEKGFGLSRADALLKTEHMARAWQAHAALREAIETFQRSKFADRVDISTKHLDYIKAVKLLRRFASGIAARQWEAFRQESEEWKLEPDADAVEFWIAAYATFASMLAALPALNDLEYPPDAVLTAFEELPDCP